MKTRLEKLTEMPIRKEIPIPGYKDWYLQYRQEELSSCGILLTAMKRDNSSMARDIIEVEFLIRKSGVVLSDYILRAQQKLSQYLGIGSQLISVIAEIAKTK